MILMRDNVFTKCINALQQVSMMIIINGTMTMMIKVTAREGKPILIIEEGDAETAAWAQHSLEVVHGDDGFDNDVGGDGDSDGNGDGQVPRTVDALQGVLTVIPLQLLSYHLAVLRSPPLSSLGHSRLSASQVLRLTCSWKSKWVGEPD